jgi:lipid-A-disaccharide synthase-like uncharacterized protein
MSKQTKPQLNIAGQQPKATLAETPATEMFESVNGHPVDQIPFTARNWQLVGLGAALLFVGYYLLGSEKFIDAQEFSVSLHIAPIVIIAGYIELIFAILHQDKH